MRLSTVYKACVSSFHCIILQDDTCTVLFDEEPQVCKIHFDTTVNEMLCTGTKATTLISGKKLS